MDESFFKIVAGVLAGGVGKHIIDHFIKYKRYAAEVNRLNIESDGLVSGNWKMLYEKLEKANEVLQLRVDKLELENAELKQKYISMQQQINFAEKL